MRSRVSGQKGQHDSPPFEPGHKPGSLFNFRKEHPMATVSKDLADRIVANSGYYKDDPRVYRIVEYTNAFGSGLSYGIEYSGQVGKYHESEYVINPRVYWEVNTPLGLSGKSGT